MKDLNMRQTIVFGHMEQVDVLEFRLYMHDHFTENVNIFVYLALVDAFTCEHYIGFIKSPRKRHKMINKLLLKNPLLSSIQQSSEWRNQAV